MKKLLAVLMVLAMLFSFAACTATQGPAAEPTEKPAEQPAEEPAAEAPAPEKEKVTLTVWGSQEDQVMLGEMIEAFKAANTEKEYEITLGVVGEPDAKTRYLEDPAAAADVFAFANDQLYDLVNAGALYEVTRNKDAIVAANGKGSVEAGMVGDKLYAYPMTADNGYFMYYDKSVFTEEDVKSLDAMLAKANEAGKKVFFDVSNGWYIASFFLGAGCKLGLENGVQTCDFNNERGVLAGEAIKKFAADPAFITGDDAVLTGGFGDNIAAGVSGTWNATAIQEKLGDNFGAAKLPTFTLGTEQVQLGSFAGYKLVGVNSMTKFPVDSMDLAEWLTNEENQLKRFRDRAMGPSNVNVAASEEVKSNLPLAALSQQGAFATGQKDVLGNYWTPAEAFGTAMEAKDYSVSIQEMLDAMVAQITAK